MVAAVSAAMLFTACSKSPEAVVNELYTAVQSKQFEKTIPYLLPDSVSAFTEQEKTAFASSMSSSTFWPEDASFSVTKVEVNPEETEARFEVSTVYGDEKNVETGILRKTAEGNWRLVFNKEAGDTVAVYSEPDPTAYSHMLMPNLRRAVTKMLAERGMAEHQFRYSYIVGGELGASNDPEGFYTWTKKAADQNHRSAIYNLAWCYYNGSGVSRDYEKALEYYTKAAEMGDDGAMHQVGRMYVDGEGTVRDYDEAYKWIKKAADMGNMKAINFLGFMYHSGYGVAKDYAKALELYKQAAALGNATSMCNLGVYYEFGYGVDKDLAEAAKWYEAGAKADYPNAMYNLAELYYNGKGVDKNYDKAFYWYKKAADAGLYNGMYMTAKCYELGRGTNKSSNLASDYYKKAYNEGRGLKKAWDDFCRLRYRY